MSVIAPPRDRRTVAVPVPAPRRELLDQPGRYARPERRAESFYRKGAGMSALLSGALIFVSILMIPFDGVGSEGYLRSNLENPEAIRSAAAVLHYGFLLLVPASFGMAYFARRGARVLSNIGLLLATLGAGLSGLVAVDFYDLALVQTLPMDQAVEVYEAAAATTGFAPALIQVPTILGTVLGTVLLSVAVRRAGFGTWFAPLTMATGWVVFFVGADYFVGAAIGTGLLAVSTALIGMRILYATDGEWETGIPE